VDYTPPTSVGADRIANAIGGLAIAPAPLIVVDLGTATTFDVIDATGMYTGGAILTGIGTSLQSLVSRTAKLPAIELKAPKTAIGKTTIHSIESGMMFGYAGAIDALVDRIERELGAKATVLTTGGLGGVFLDLCERIDRYEPMLTLDGLRLYDERS
jgi:type III pantothenate kinase